VCEAHLNGLINAARISLPVQQVIVLLDVLADVFGGKTV